MRRGTIRDRSAPWIGAEPSDAALAHLFEAGGAPVESVFEPAAVRIPVAVPLSRWTDWATPPRFLEADETHLRLEDGGVFHIREVPREARAMPEDLDFEIFVEEEVGDITALAPRAVENLDDFRAEFEADLAVFEGISGTKKGGPVARAALVCFRNLVGAAGLEPATPAV